MSEQTYTGSCFCGAVELQVTGESFKMGYCHCGSCRSWSACPVTAFTLWKKDQVVVTKGQDKLRSFAKTPKSKRIWCDACGGHVMTEHEKAIDVYAATIPTVPFQPAVHLHYQETVLRIRDGLPKQKDVAVPAGGSGVLIDE